MPPIPLPKMPKLAATAVPDLPGPPVQPEASDANPFDLLDEASFDAMVAEMMGNPQTPLPSGSGPKGAEDEEPEADAEETGGLDVQSLATMAEAAASEAAGYVQQIEMLLDQAELVRDGDPKGVKRLLKEAEGLAKEAEKAGADATSAADKEDLAKVAAAAQAADGACKAIAELLEEARGLAGTAPASAAAAVPDAAEGATGGGKGVSRGGPAGPVAPLAIWAQRAGSR